MINNEKHCEKCGFKNSQSDKFCGGCGKDLDLKPKKKRNYAEFFLFIGFIFSFANLTDPTFGFELSSSAEATGYNFSTILWYLVYIGTAIRVITKARKKDKVAQEEDQSETGWKKYNHILRAGVVVALTLVILVTTAIYTYNSYAPKNVNTIFEDALYGTHQSGDIEYVALLSEIFETYREDSVKQFSATVALDSSNVLEYESFETKISLDNSIILLKTSISELEKADEILLKIKEKAKEKIRNSDLPEEEKVGVLNSFNKSANDTDKMYYSQRRYQTLKQSYQEILELYKFLRTNFNDYYIDFDKYGEENIFFYTDTNIEIYNIRMTDIQKASLRFVEAERLLLDFINKQLESKGIDIKAEDFQNTLIQ